VEIKLARIKEEIKYYEYQKKELLNELKIVQIYEELNNIVREFDPKERRTKKVFNDYGFSQNENEREKVYEKINEIKELIKTQNEKRICFNLLSFRIYIRSLPHPLLSTATK
jgi:hypothetical protein